MHTSDLITRLSIQDGRAAHVVIIDAKGSAPRHEGSRMLVLPDGNTLGTIGGGVVEAQAIQLAVACIESGESRLFVTDMLGETALGSESVCGGSITMAILLVADGSLFVEAAACLGRGECVVLASPLPPKLAGVGTDLDSKAAVIDATGRVVRGDPRWPDEAALRTALESGLPVVSTADGRLYDPLLPRDRLLILGGGHVGQALARFAIELDFQVCVADPRPEMLAAGRFPAGVETRLGSYTDLVAGLPAGKACYVVVVSPSHSTDLECVRAILKREYRYTGFMGSRRKVRMILDQATSEGFPANKVQALRAPIGADIGAETPAEIAVAILAEIIATRRNSPTLAARDAASEAPNDVARDAARETTREADGAATKDAAREADRAATKDAAREADGAATKDAAREAAREAARNADGVASVARRA
jgi:xanthine dehydrogenase accessory factor